MSKPGNSGVKLSIYPPSAPDPTIDTIDAIDRLPPSNNTKSAATPPSRSCSVKSTKSVDSNIAMGAFPFGSLRLMEARESLELDTVMENPIDSKKELFPTGGDVLILDDLPPNFTVGCDTMSFSTKKAFPGFREIPSGAHLIWVAPSELTSTRSAYWIVTPEREESELAEVYVKQWDTFNEILSEPASQAEERFQRERLKEMYDSLSPYQLRAAASGVRRSLSTQDVDDLPSFLSNATVWTQLTSAIHPGLLNRITGKTQKSWQVTTLDHVAGEATMAEEARIYIDDSSHLRFLFPMNAPLISPSAQGAERTQQALDPSSFVIDVLENAADGRRPLDLVGELSFAFLTGMHLGNYSCLEQWWFYANRVLFRSFALATSRPRLALRLVRTFHTQLVYNDRYLEGDILDTMPEEARKLQRALATYKARLNEALLALGDRISPDQHALGQAFEHLESWLWRIGWDLRGEYVRPRSLVLDDGERVHADLSDFDDDDDDRADFAPVVVVTDADGKDTGLVSWDKE
ncbi:hypothetical protein F4804DRAFT_223003 [Jackrogersella minutella]|nr:hypothetical protein F4804DRAFT_223003 [Jackrogersella minutella]